MVTKHSKKFMPHNQSKFVIDWMKLCNICCVNNTNTGVLFACTQDIDGALLIRSAATEFIFHPVLSYAAEIFGCLDNACCFPVR